MIVGNLLGVILLAGFLSYKQSIPEGTERGWHDQLTRGNLPTALWSINLLSNAVLIFIETLAASYPLIEGLCTHCPVVHSYDEARHDCTLRVPRQQ